MNAAKQLQCLQHNSILHYNIKILWTLKQNFSSEFKVGLLL